MSVEKNNKEPQEANKSSIFRDTFEPISLFLIKMFQNYPFTRYLFFATVGVIFSAFIRYGLVPLGAWVLDMSNPSATEAEQEEGQKEQGSFTDDRNRNGNGNKKAEPLPF